MRPLVSVLFITFDRLVTLRPTLDSFLAGTAYPRDCLELIVCDDSSPKLVQDEIMRMPFDVFCIAKERGGLGANVNRGLKAARGELILQLQDDWRCNGPNTYLMEAIAVLNRSADIGMIIFNQHPEKLEIARREEFGERTVQVYANQPNTLVNMVGEHAYTDWPHLKRRAFHDRLGLYKEGVPMWEAELDFSRRVNAQMSTFIADFEGLKVFEHIGENYSYNTSSRKARLAKKIMSYPCGTTVMHVYAWLKQMIKGKNARS